MVAHNLDLACVWDIKQNQYFTIVWIVHWCTILNENVVTFTLLCKCSLFTKYIWHILTVSPAYITGPQISILKNIHLFLLGIKAGEWAKQAKKSMGKTRSRSRIWRSPCTSTGRNRIIWDRIRSNRNRNKNSYITRKRNRN